MTNTAVTIIGLVGLSMLKQAWSTPDMGTLSGRENSNMVGSPMVSSNTVKDTVMGNEFSSAQHRRWHCSFHGASPCLHSPAGIQTASQSSEYLCSAWTTAA